MVWRLAWRRARPVHRHHVRVPRLAPDFAHRGNPRSPVRYGLSYVAARAYLIAHLRDWSACLAVNDAVCARPVAAPEGATIYRSRSHGRYAQHKDYLAASRAQFTEYRRRRRHPRHPDHDHRRGGHQLPWRRHPATEYQSRPDDLKRGEQAGDKLDGDAVALRGARGARAQLLLHGDGVRDAFDPRTKD